jgi:hypothetical protein
MKKQCQYHCYTTYVSYTDFTVCQYPSAPSPVLSLAIFHCHICCMCSVLLPTALSAEHGNAHTWVCSSSPYRRGSAVPLDCAVQVADINEQLPTPEIKRVLFPTHSTLKFCYHYWDWRHSQVAMPLSVCKQKKKETSSVYDCTVEDVEYICNSNSALVD